MNTKTIYNPDSKESLNDRRIFGGNPDGMINFTKMKYQWALNLWDTMEANTWFPKEVQMTGDAKDYKYLTVAEKRMYDLVLSQLIFMDSLQTNNLMDNINLMRKQTTLNHMQLWLSLFLIIQMRFTICGKQMLN